MSDASTSALNLASTQRALQEIQDLPVTLLKSAFDVLIPPHLAPTGLRRPSRKMPSASSMRCSRDFGTLRGSGALESPARTGNTEEFS